MKVLRYITFELKDGSLIKDKIVPLDINTRNIHTISPMFTKRGILYKNTSIIVDNFGESFKVVGNYNTLINLRDNNNLNKIGFK